MTTNDGGGGIAVPSPSGTQDTQDERNRSHNGTQGPIQLQSSPPHRAVLVWGLLLGLSVLSLLIILAIVFRRCRAQRGTSLRKLRSPMTPSLPIQAPPARSPIISKPRNPFFEPSDLEKGVGYPEPMGPEENPFADGTRAKPPTLPARSVVRVRDARNDGRSDKLRVQSNARDQQPTMPIRPARPPTLKLA